jgi:hypothetical protein
LLCGPRRCCGVFVRRLHPLASRSQGAACMEVWQSLPVNIINHISQPAARSQWP